MYKTEFDYQSDPANWINDEYNWYSAILNEKMTQINYKLMKKGVKPRRIEPKDPNRLHYDQFKKCVSSTNSTHT